MMNLVFTSMWILVNTRVQICVVPSPLHTNPPLSLSHDRPFIHFRDIESEVAGDACVRANILD